MNTPTPTSTRAPAFARTAPQAAEGKTIEEIAAGFRVGLCLFDNPKEMKEGWAFLPGENAYRIRDSVDLANTVMWITNADYNAVKENKDRGKNVRHHEKQLEYLSLKLNAISKDVGLRIEGADVEEGGMLLAPFIENVVQNAIFLYNLTDPMRQTQDEKLSKAIHSTFPYVQLLKENMLQRLSSATQNWSSCSSMYVDNTTTLQMRFARVPYAQYLLSQQYPDSSWFFIPTDENFNHDLVMSGKCAPHLIRVVLEFDIVNFGVADLIAFGAGVGTKTRREWVTDVEYRWLAQFARIQVLEYCFSKAYTPLSKAYQLPEKMTDDVVMAYPLSMGVLAHVHCQAVMNTRRNHGMRRQDETLLSVWMRAYDRAKCFEAAFVLQQKGFMVGGYGSGSVTVKCENSRLNELAELGHYLGLTLPVQSCYVPGA